MVLVFAAVCARNDCFSRRNDGGPGKGSSGLVPSHLDWLRRSRSYWGGGVLCRLEIEPVDSKKIADSYRRVEHSDQRVGSVSVTLCLASRTTLIAAQKEGDDVLPE